MFNFRTLAIIKRELKDKLLSRTFILMTVLIPVFMIGILAFQTFVMSIEGDEDTVLSFVSGNRKILNDLQSEFAFESFVKGGEYKLNFHAVEDKDFESFLNEAKPGLLNESLTALIQIPETAQSDKKVNYYSKSPRNMAMVNKIRGTINKALINHYFKDKSLTEEEVNFARSNVDFQDFRVTTKEGIKEEGVGNRILSFLITFLLYFSLIMLGTMVMRSVVEEKTSRISEILLSSVSSTELMTGKILGNSIIGVIQMAIWLSPLILLISSTIFMLPAEFAITLSMSQLLFFLLNYFVGLITFLGLFASVGAIFDNDQDAQSGMWPVMMLIMIPFFISFSMVNNPNNTLALFASILPFSSIIVMPARMTLIEVPLWQTALSLLINIGMIFVIFYIAGKIYRIGLLMTGKKPKWSEVIGWVREKY